MPPPLYFDSYCTFNFGLSHVSRISERLSSSEKAFGVNDIDLPMVLVAKHNPFLHTIQIKLSMHFECFPHKILETVANNVPNLSHFILTGIRIKDMGASLCYLVRHFQSLESDKLRNIKLGQNLLSGSISLAVAGGFVTRYFKSVTP